MRTINITINNDADYNRLKAFLKTIDSAKKAVEVKAKTKNAITLASEESLAEEWLSAEDERYEQYFKA